MSSRLSGGVIGLALLVLSTPIAHRAASAQCLISGPSTICNGDFSELCGPIGLEYDWTLPDGSQSWEMCVPVFGPGVWTLRVFDPATGQWLECSHTVTLAGGGTGCLIDGPTNACEGTTVTLCGPEGAGAWNWSGPGDFFSTEQCIEVTSSGSYTLAVPGSGDCGGGELTLCSHDVTFEACGTVANCPRPVSFWKRPCRDEADERSARISPAQFAQVAACVDQRVSLFDWSDDEEGFCRVLRPRALNLRTKAIRQFATVWANVCAGEASIVPARGPMVGLDPYAQVRVGDTHQTVAGWLSEAEATLASLQGASMRNEDAKHAYRRIIRAGWLLNHGQGMDVVCGFGSGKGSQLSLDDDAIMAEDLEGDESLAAALVDESEAPMSMELAGPNPFTTNSAVAFMLGSPEPREVNIGVYDLTGRLVRQLASGVFQPGRHELRWDGLDTGGTPVRGGMYFVIGRVGGDRVDARLTLLR